MKRLEYGIEVNGKEWKLCRADSNMHYDVYKRGRCSLVQCLRGLDWKLYLGKSVFCVADNEPEPCLRHVAAIASYAGEL